MPTLRRVEPAGGFSLDLATIFSGDAGEPTVSVTSNAPRLAHRPTLEDLESMAAQAGVVLGWTFVRWMVGNPTVAVYSTCLGPGETGTSGNLVTLNEGTVRRLARDIHAVGGLTGVVTSSIGRQIDYLFRLGNWVRRLGEGRNLSSQIREEAEAHYRTIGQLAAAWGDLERVANSLSGADQDTDGPDADDYEPLEASQL